MDFGIIDVVHPLDPSLGVPPHDVYEPARYAMGDTRRYAERMNLIDMAPRGDLASTGYALANPGVEYLVLQPDESVEELTVELAAGTYDVEWFGVTNRETSTDPRLAVARAGGQRFSAPMGAGPAVLYLTRAQG
jgi:hypothetical protein